MGNFVLRPRVLLANLSQNVTISPLENATFLRRSAHNVTTYFEYDYQF